MMNEPACIDLRPWAKANRFRWHYEESYHAERPENRGDGRWFVEVLCKYGLIYPKGEGMLLAYASPGMKSKIRDIRADVVHHQSDGNSEVFRFPLSRLDEVAAILKPKRLGGSVSLTPEQLANLQEGRKRLEKHRAKQEITNDQSAEVEGQG
jgi:hypothetical protein